MREKLNGGGKVNKNNIGFLPQELFDALVPDLFQIWNLD
jgi:hypothetical protein